MKRVLLIGGSGKFGSELANRLSSVHEVVLASRSGHVPIDRERMSEKELTSRFAGFSHVIDVAGPFQNSDYRVAKAAISAGCNYIDIADSVDFLLGFPAELDDLARKRGVYCITGASTTPAFTSSIVRQFGFARIDSVDSSIHATGGPAGLSVMRAVLTYCGRRVVDQFDMGKMRKVIGWRKLEWKEGRLQSDVATVDPVLFSSKLGVRLRSTFRAALDSQLMQLGMCVLSFIPKVDLVKLAPVLHKLQHVFLFASEKGALFVRARGVKQGRFIESRFALLSDGSQGFAIPIIPVLALLAKRDQITPGARICLDELSFDELTDAIECHVNQVHWRSEEINCGNVFSGLVNQMSPICAKFHSTENPPIREGMIDVEVGTSWISRIAQFASGLPKENSLKSRLRVAAERGIENGVPFERWTRVIDGKSFFSVLTRNKNNIMEKFGPLEFELGAHVNEKKELVLPVKRMYIFGLRVPAIVKSDSKEFQDAQGRYAFDVKISCFGNLVVHYKGFLE